MSDDLRLTDTQRKILEALCRPCTGETHFAPPATNQEIADELFLSVDAIKAHLRVLYKKFGIEPLPHNQKRARLVELALADGVVTNEGSAAEMAGKALESAGPGAVAVPADSPGALEAPPQSPKRVPVVTRPAGLIAAGIVIGALVIAVIAVLILNGGSDSSGDPTPTRSAYVATVSRLCTLAADPSKTYMDATRAKRAFAYSGTFGSVRGPLETDPVPAGDNPGLGQFMTGIASAADLNSEVATTPASAPASALATTSADLTIAAGNIQAGAIKFHLGSACRELGALAGDSGENAAGPP